MHRTQCWNRLAASVSLALVLVTLPACSAIRGPWSAAPTAVGRDRRAHSRAVASATALCRLSPDVLPVSEAEDVHLEQLRRSQLSLGRSRRGGDTDRFPHDDGPPRMAELVRVRARAGDRTKTGLQRNVRQRQNGPAAPSSGTLLRVVSGRSRLSGFCRWSGIHRLCRCGQSQGVPRKRWTLLGPAMRRLSRECLDTLVTGIGRTSTDRVSRGR